MIFLRGGKSAGGQVPVPCSTAVAEQSLYPDTHLRQISKKKILYLEGLSGHCSAASAGTPYSTRSTSRWCGGCHRTRSPWYTAEAPASGLSPEPSSLLRGTELQPGIKNKPGTAVRAGALRHCVLQLIRKEHKGSQESPVPARAQQHDPRPLSTRGS